ncbi:MAG: spore coat protein GerQ [Mycobacterium leprae]
MSFAGYPGSMGYPTQGMMAQPAGYQVPAGYQGPTYPPAQAMRMGPGQPEESYIENILRLNHGKIGTFYFTYQGNNQWNAKVYRGRVETAGRDHIIISDHETGKRYLLLMSNLDWVEFDEKLNYPTTPQLYTRLQTTD